MKNRNGLMTDLTHERLKMLLHYDPESGIFTRLSSASTRPLKGKPAGSANGSGYLFIMLDKRRYQAHRLAWFYMTGAWPKKNLDHRDMNVANNKWGNLREASNSQNGANRARYANNTSGFKGVIWDKKHKAWVARVRVNRKYHYLGSFRFAEQAHRAYALAAKEAFGEFARV